MRSTLLLLSLLFSLLVTPTLQTATLTLLSDENNEDEKQTTTTPKKGRKKRRAPVIVGQDGHSHTFGDPTDPQPISFETVLSRAERKEKALQQKDPRKQQTATMNKNKNLLLLSFLAAFRSGLPGALAGMIQVFMTMWSRTIMNYQYRFVASERSDKL